MDGFSLQGLCLSCFIISIVFAHGAGSYVFQLMDSFAGSYSLLIIAFFECIGVAYVYGIKRWICRSFPIMVFFSFQNFLIKFFQTFRFFKKRSFCSVQISVLEWFWSRNWLFSFGFCFINQNRFADDIELMTGSRPALYWMICWKYLSPAAMIIILIASFLELSSSGSNYPAWNPMKGITEPKEWPNWCIFLAIFLILVSIIWIPVIAIARFISI